MSLRECFEHEHCAYLSSRTPVRFAAQGDDFEITQTNEVLSVFRKPASV